MRRAAVCIAIGLAAGCAGPDALDSRIVYRDAPNALNDLLEDASRFRDRPDADLVEELQRLANVDALERSADDSIRYALLVVAARGAAGAAEARRALSGVLDDPLAPAAATGLAGMLLEFMRLSETATEPVDLEALAAIREQSLALESARGDLAAERERRLQLERQLEALRRLEAALSERAAIEDRADE